MSDYTPSWAGDSESGFDSADDYPEDFQYGGGLDHEDPWEGPESVGSGSSEPRPKRETFGEERHPSMALNWRDGERAGYIDLTSFEIDRWEGEGGVRYTIVAEGITEADAIPCDAEVRMLHVHGTRVGDTATEDVDILSAEDSAVVLEPTEAGEIGALYRWMATGCLICRSQCPSCGGGQR